MTTKPSVVFAGDIFAPNEVYHLVREQCPEVEALAGIVWLFKDPPRRAHVRGFAAALAATNRVNPALRPWLLGGHAVSQEDTPLARRRRFWGSLGIKDLELPLHTATEELMVEIGGGIRWFAALPLSSDAHVQSAAKVIEVEKASMIVALDERASQELPELLTRGWSSSLQQPPVAVLTWVVRRGGILLWPVGAFDDPESGAVAFGESSLVEQLHGSRASAG